MRKLPDRRNEQQISNVYQDTTVMDETDNILQDNDTLKDADIEAPKLVLNNNPVKTMRIKAKKLAPNNHSVKGIDNKALDPVQNNPPQKDVDVEASNLIFNNNSVKAARFEALSPMEIDSPAKPTPIGLNNVIQLILRHPIMEIFQPAIPGLSNRDRAKYVAKWLFFGSIIGVTSGIGAIVLSLCISIATNLLLGNFVGYFPPEANGEGITKFVPITNLWFLPIITTVGGLLSGLLVFFFASDAEGHGTDSVIDAIHYKNGKINARVPFVKLIASAITIGSGGSSGREGPVAQIGAGLGSIWGNLFHLSPKDRRVTVTIAVGAGIGAIFKAPFGGALLAAEILYLRDVEIEVFIPAIIASTIGYTAYGFFFGFAPIFGNLQISPIQSPIQFVYYGILGVFAGLSGICYTSSFYGLNKFFQRLKLPKWLKPAIAGLLVGCMGLLFPQILGISYGWVQLFMDSKFLLTIPLWVLLVLPFAKMIATGLSIGSGGSGGTHGPGMVIGAFVGAFLWSIMHSLPFMPQEPAVFVIVGMIALFGAVAHTPIAVTVLLAEMTGSLAPIPPAMLALAISITIVGNNTIFRSQVLNRISLKTKGK